MKRRNFLKLTSYAVLSSLLPIKMSEGETPVKQLVSVVPNRAKMANKMVASGDVAKAAMEEFHIALRAARIRKPVNYQN